MTGTVVSIGRAENRTTLGPTSSIGRIPALVCQKTKLVGASPAVTCRVSQECLSAVVERSGSFVDGKFSNLLP